MIRKILELAKTMPSGLPDSGALEKLIAERQEFNEASTRAERVEEAVDQYYYAIKLIHLVATECDLSIDQLHQAAIAKLSRRAAGLPKDKPAERAAMMKAALSLNGPAGGSTGKENRNARI